MNRILIQIIHRIITIHHFHASRNFSFPYVPSIRITNIIGILFGEENQRILTKKNILFVILRDKLVNKTWIFILVKRFKYFNIFAYDHLLSGREKSPVRIDKWSVLTLERQEYDKISTRKLIDTNCLCLKYILTNEWLLSLKREGRGRKRYSCCRLHKDRLWVIRESVWEGDFPMTWPFGRLLSSGHGLIYNLYDFVV